MQPQIDRATKLYPELSFASFLGDSAHDNYPTYDLLTARSITPIIALNERHTVNICRTTFRQLKIN